MRSLTLSLFSLAALSGVAFAGQVVADSKKVIEQPCVPASTTWVDTSSSYTFESDFKRGTNAFGDSLMNDIQINQRIPLNIFAGWPNVACGQWYLRLGAYYERYDFGNHPGDLPLPSVLQGIAGVVALEYVVGNDAAIMLEARPGVYFEHSVRSDNFDVPIRLYAPIYHKKTDTYSFTIIAGVAYGEFFSTEFLPVGGFVLSTGKLTIKAVPPAPRIIYSPTKNLDVWVGGELAGGGFRTDKRDDNGHGLDSAVVTYTEYRAGAGLTYKCSNVSLDLGAGYAFERKFDFFRAEKGYQTENGAPYVKGELQIAF